MNKEIKRAAKADLPLVFLIIFLDMLGIGIIIPILGAIFIIPETSILPVAYTLTTRSILFGLLIAIYPLAQFFGAPMLGALSDRYGRKKVFLISLIGTFVGYLLFGLGILTKQVWLLFLSRLIDGFTGGNISVAQSTMADISTKETKTRNFGLIGVAFGLGFIMGPFIGGKLADKALVPWFTLSTPLWFAAILAFINILFLVFFFRETLQTRIKTKISLLTGFRNIRKAINMQNLRTIFLVNFLIMLGFNFFTQFFQILLIEKFAYTESQIGNLFAYIGIWIAITQGIIVRPIAKWIRPEKVMIFAALLLGLVFPLLLVPEKAYWLFIILPFVSIFQGLILPNSTTIVSNQADERSQGEILGINQSVSALAQTIPPLIAGFIIAININMPIIAASICTLVGWLIFVLFYRKNLRQKFVED